MKWLDKLERKYRQYAIPNLIQYIVGGMAIVFVFSLLNPGITSALYFSPVAVLQGQVWRIFTFLVIPRTGSAFWILFSLLFTFFVGRSLESYFGTFKFNVFYFMGVIGTILSSIILTLLFRVDFPTTNEMIHTSMFLALATIAPDYEIRIYMILPVKLKYLGMIAGAFILLELLGALLVLDFGTVLATIVAIGNYLVFFGPGLMNRINNKNRKQAYKAAHQPRGKTVHQPQSKGKVIQVAFHCCEVCGKTEVDDPNLEFRYCSKCAGRHEYCSEHILNHEHVKEDQ